ncbi:MAG: hypothetical protein GF411_03625 [Candidatus Lokiarchaeota archaeon]|nr:hypothetical protein [Candidatus Lokiarchaeota archaeon]
MGPNPHPIWPIEWVFSFQKIIDYLQKLAIQNTSKTKPEIFVGDFGAGRNEEIPLFFSKVIQNSILENSDWEKPYPIFKVYCTDVHTLRIEDLFSKLVDEDIIEHSRVVHAGLEDMGGFAVFPLDQKEVIAELEKPTWIDVYINDHEAFPENSIDIGIMNNDMLGYLAEYYTEYSDLKRALEGAEKIIKQEGLFLVTQPCSLYKFDNIEVLENTGFSFLMGADIDKQTGEIEYIKKDTDPKRLGNLNHYTFLAFINE